MKILVYYFNGGGGGLSNFIELLRGYANQFPSDQLFIVSGASALLTGVTGVKNVGVMPVDIKGRNKEWRRLVLGLGGIHRVAKELNVDVVWSLNLGMYRPAGIPQVLSINNAHQLYPISDLPKHPSGAASLSLLRWFFRRSLASSAAVLVQTELMGKYCAALGRDSGDIHVIPKAPEIGSGSTQPPEELLRPLRASDDGFVFLYVSSSVPHKNHRVLFDAFRIAAERGIQVKLAVTLTRQDVSSIGGSCADRLVREGIVIPLGWVKPAHLSALYQACDACVMPSLLESLSSSYLEAMHWGKPQIVSDLPFARDVCMEAAVYVDATDPDKWVAAMQRMISDKELCARLVVDGLNRVRAFPQSWHECASQVRGVLMAVVDAAKSRL